MREGKGVVCLRRLYSGLWAGWIRPGVRIRGSGLLVLAFFMEFGLGDIYKMGLLYGFKKIEWEKIVVFVRFEI